MGHVKWQYKRRMQVKALAMTRHYEYTKEEKKKDIMAGCFFVPFGFLHGDCFQTVSRNIAHRKFICISGVILALRGAGCFRHYFTAAEKSGADSNTIISGVFIPHFRCGISGI